jgi:hypothetical protein
VRLNATILGIDPPRIVTLTEIINDHLGHPDIFGHPHTFPADAIHKTKSVIGSSIDGEGTGRMLEWMVEVAEWEDDND